MRISAAIGATILTAAMLWSWPAAARPHNAPGHGPAVGPRAEKVDHTGPGRNLPPGMGPGERGRRAVTPYGDFCTRCSKYGMGKRPVSRDKAVEAIKHYFVSKGFKIKNIRGKGRFLKVDIYKKDKLVDRVIFDRRTGRIRSIY